MNVGLAYIVVYLLAGGFMAFLTIMIVRDNLASRLNRVTGAMLLFAGLGPLFMAFGAIVRQSPTASVGFDDSTLYYLQYLWEFFFPMLLLFSWIFPEDRMRQFKHPIWRFVIFVPQLLHLLLMLWFEHIASLLDVLRVDPEAGGFTSIILVPLSKFSSLIMLVVGSIRNYDVVIFGIINVLYILSAVYFLESSRRLVTNPRLLTQTRVVFRGLRIGLGLYVVTFLGEMLFPRQFSDALSSALLILSVLITMGVFAYAAVRYQFLDVRLKFRQSFVYTIISAVLVGVYIIVVIKSRNLLTPFFGAQAEIVSYAFIILVLLLFQPLNSIIDSLLRSLFMRTRTDHRNIIERFSRQVISLFDPLKLRQIIEENLKTSLLVEKVYFVLFDDEIGEYAILRSDDFQRRMPLDRDDLLLRGINLLESPTYFRSLADFCEGSGLARMLQERGVKLVLPMKDAKHMLGFLALTDKVAGYRYSSEDLNLLGVLSNQMVTALTNARLYVDSLERIRLQEEVSMARQIQLDLLPSSPPLLNTATICVHSTPSRTVGGDFYDFIAIDDKRLGVVIADASGKGMPAALMITQIQAIIRSEVNNGNRIATMLTNMNNQVAKATSAEKFVTLFYGELDINRGELTYCNAGHNYPILIRSDGNIELLKTGGPLVGALFGMEYVSTSVRMSPDDILFLFTDGLSEAMDEEEHEYGEDRIRQLVCDHRRHEPQIIMDDILADVRRFDPTYPPRDDTTIVTIKMNSKLVCDD